jgi:hypothetical protein
LKQEYEKIEKTIAEARIQHDRLTGGLIKTLIALRLELLRTNAALVQQRILALETGARITITTSATVPDAGRATELEKEMRAIGEQISTQEMESSKYGGGLIKSMLESTIATSRFSLEMLKIEYLKAKHGIHWVPSLKTEQDKASVATGSLAKERVGGGEWQQQVSVTDETKENSASVLVPTLTNKRFLPRNARSGIYDDSILFDIEWNTAGLSRQTRAVKGILEVGNLFGDVRFSLSHTINQPLRPGQKFKEAGLGFRYNQFRSEDQVLARQETRQSVGDDAAPPLRQAEGWGRQRMAHGRFQTRPVCRG